MSAQLDFPVIAPDQAAAPAQQKQSFAEIVRAQYAAEEPAMRSLAAKYKGVAFDCTTTKGLDAAKAARLELREQGRFKLQRAAEATKAEANDLKRVIDAESARLIAIVKPVEDEVHSQITAEEERKAAEKAERERLAAELKAHHDGKIATIRACADRARGLPSERIANGISQVEGLAFGQDCGDFLAQYEAAKAETLTAMRVLLAEAQAREAAEAQRLENERVAAELAAQKKALEDQAAELLRQRVAATHAIVFTFPEFVVSMPSQTTLSELVGDGGAALPGVELLRGELGHVDAGFTIASPAPVLAPAAPPACGPVAGIRVHQPDSEPPAPLPPAKAYGGMDEARTIMAATSDVRAIPMGLPSTNEAATLKLGTICERLGITMTAAFVADTLGIAAAGTDKRAVLYRESDFKRICQALANHALKCMTQAPEAVQA